MQCEGNCAETSLIHIGRASYGDAVLLPTYHRSQHYEVQSSCFDCCLCGRQFRFWRLRPSAHHSPPLCSSRPSSHYSAAFRRSRPSADHSAAFRGERGCRPAAKCIRIEPCIDGEL